MKKLDGLDSEAIREMQRSRGWQLFTERRHILRARKVSDLIGHLPEKETQAARGYIAALDDILTIPDTIVSEIKAKGGSK